MDQRHDEAKPDMDDDCPQQLVATDEADYDEAVRQEQERP